MDFKEIWQSIKDFFTNNIWGIVTFFAVLIIGFIVVKILINVTRKILGKTKMEKITQQFLITTLKLILYLVLFKNKKYLETLSPLLFNFDIK